MYIAAISLDSAILHEIGRDTTRKSENYELFRVVARIISLEGLVQHVVEDIILLSPLRVLDSSKGDIGIYT